MESPAPAVVDRDLFDLRLDPVIIAYLKESSKWAKFLAIVGFIFCALMAIVGIFAGQIIASSMGAAFQGASSFGGAVFSILYLFFALMWFFPCLFLFRFSNNLQRAINNNEQDRLLASFKNLTSHYRFLGIVTIILLSLYALAIVGGIAAAVLINRG